MSTAAHRQRAHRLREANGRIVLQIEVDDAALCAALVDGGFISPNDQLVSCHTERLPVRVR